MNKKLNEVKNNFKVNHAARMVNLEKAIESSRETQAQKPEETKNTKKIVELNDLLSSL